jgi:hypothetical protein
LTAFSNGGKDVVLKKRFLADMGVNSDVAEVELKFTPDGLTGGATPFFSSRQI